MLSTPIYISLSEIGIRMFKTTSIAPIPYYLLDNAQCDFVRAYLTSVSEGAPCNISSGPDGGFVLRIPPPVQNIFTDKTEVCNCLKHAIHNASGYGDKQIKEKVLSILFQRISALATIPMQKNNKP
eukprot:3932346-Rhodomonas_salina.3